MQISNSSNNESFPTPSDSASMRAHSSFLVTSQGTQHFPLVSLFKCWRGNWFLLVFSEVIFNICQLYFQTELSLSLWTYSFWFLSKQSSTNLSNQTKNTKHSSTLNSNSSVLMTVWLLEILYFTRKKKQYQKTKYK